MTSENKTESINKDASNKRENDLDSSDFSEDNLDLRVILNRIMLWVEKIAPNPTPILSTLFSKVPMQIFGILAFIVALTGLFGLKGTIAGVIFIICTYVLFLHKDEKNVETKEKSTGNGNIYIIIFEVSLFLLLAGSVTYFLLADFFLEPSIDIKSPTSEEIVYISADTPYFTIYGDSKGIVNNPFLHPLFLCRKIDSDQCLDWHEYDTDSPLFSMYADGSWEYLIPVSEMYAELENEQYVELDKITATEFQDLGVNYIYNETFIVKSPCTQSNNTYGTLEIVAIVGKQSLINSIRAKVETGSFYTNDNLYDVFYSDGHFTNSVAASHVMVKPLIYEYNYTVSYLNMLQMTISPPTNNFHLITSDSFVDMGGDNQLYVTKDAHWIDLWKYGDLGKYGDFWIGDYDRSSNIYHRGEEINIFVTSVKSLINFGDTNLVTPLENTEKPSENVTLFLDGNPLVEKTSQEGYIALILNTTGIHNLTAVKNGFTNTTVKIIVEEPKPWFLFSDLSINQEEIDYGGELEIAVDVVNIGALGGQREVKFVIDGNVAMNETIYLDPGQRKNIKCSYESKILGEHKVEVEKLSRDFKVAIPIAFIGVICFIFIFVIIYLFRRSRG